MDRRRGIYRFILISYIAVLFLALSCGVIFLIKIRAQIVEENILSQQTLLSSLKSDVENRLDDLENQANSLAFDKELLLYIQHPDLYASNTLKQALAARSIRKDYLLDGFLYLPKSDEVVSASIRMDAARFFDIIYQFDGISLSELHQTYLDPYHFNSLLGTLYLHQYGQEQDIAVIPYLQSLPISNFSTPSAQLILLLDAQKLFAQANVIHQNTQNDVYILDETGTVVYATADAPALDPAKLDHDAEAQRIDGHLLVQSGAGQRGWRYGIAVPYRQYLQQNVSTLVFFCGIFLLYTVGGLLLVRRLARRSYQPVKDIGDLILGAETGAVRGKDEYETLRHTLLQQIRSHKELRAALDAQQSVMQRDCLARLLRGQVTDAAAVRQELEQLGVCFETDIFLCAIVAFDPDSPFFAYQKCTPTENMALAKLIVENVGCELLGRAFTCYRLDMFNNQSLFLLCLKQASNPHDPEVQVSACLEQLMELAQTRYDMDLWAGVSQPESGLAHLLLCYDEARKALDHNRFATPGKASCFKDTALAKEDYYYPPETQQQLILAVRGGNSAEAHALVDQLFHTNFSEKKISSVAARSFLYQLGATLSQELNSASLLQGQAEPFSGADLEHLLDRSSAEHMRQQLHSMLDCCVPQRGGRALSRAEDLVNKITEYIDAHIENNGLDLNALSDEFGVTPQYISLIFKKQRNENVKDYISRQKLARAQVLLVDTNLPLRDIAARLGYGSEISVIRLFRKHLNTTPGEYRARCQAPGPLPS